MNVPLTTAPSSATPFNARPRKTATDENLVAAGVIITTTQGNALFLKRGDDGDHSGEWCWPGGGLESGEDAETAVIRETREETGWIVDGPMHKLDQRQLDGVDFTTFETMTGNEFIPTLNDEHVGWAWAPLDNPPQPLHPGCKKTLDMAMDTAANQATESELRSVIKYPPEKGNGTRAINVAMENGGAGKTLKSAPEAKRFVVTGKTEDCVAEDFSLTDAATAALQSAISQITHVSNPHIDDQIDYIVNNFASISGFAKSKARQLLSGAIARRKHANDMATDVAIILDSYAILCAYRSR